MKRILFVAGISMACGALAAASLDEVKVDTGSLKGAINGGVATFKGIPFAAPPIGENRWRAPQPAAVWKGVRAATAYGSDCMQLPFPSDAAPLGTKPNEDCLYLNVWTPVERATKKLPVMVWIYGGGFVNGGSSPAVYDGTHFAERGVVFVSFNYRLGRFGFFAHPALTENSTGPIGDYGYLDQIAALQWVKKNVAAFGGDAADVTIFGESAGGGSVLTMMTSPLAHGLFEKAIIESGGGRSGLFPGRRLHESTAARPSAEAVGVLFAEKTGIKGTDKAALTALRQLPAEKVVDGLNMASMMSPTYAGPMLDGKIATETPEEAFAAGRAAKVPLIVGANSADIGFSFAKSLDEVFAPFGANSDKAKAAYDPDGAGKLRAVGTLVAADAMMIEPARFLARAMAAAGQPSYEYRFSYVAQSMRKQWQGAPHATEIPFMFDTVAARYEKDLAPEDEATAKAAVGYWVAFAKSGDPNGEGRPKWPVYDAKSDELMNFTGEGPVAQADPWRERLDLTAAVAEKR